MNKAAGRLTFHNGALLKSQLSLETSLVQFVIMEAHSWKFQPLHRCFIKEARYEVGQKVEKEKQDKIGWGKSAEMINVYSLHRSELKFSRKNEPTSSSHSIHNSPAEATISA